MVKEDEKLQAYKDYLREGLVKYTRKAFEMLPKRAFPSILDIGCGSGIPTLELAKLNGGNIIAIDTNQDVLNRMTGNIIKKGLSNRVKIEKCSMFNMDFPDESFDIIWAEGSISVIGFERGLKEWRRFIKAGGFLVVHDDMGNLMEKRAEISRCGYELTDHFILSEDIWWNEYYALLEKKFNEVRAKNTSSRKPIAIPEDDQREIDTFKRDPKRYRSVFFIMKKVNKSALCGKGSVK